MSDPSELCMDAGVKLPIRPAPEPPKSKALWKNGTSVQGGSKNSPFTEPFRLSRSQSAGKLGEIKKPPPRPPLPMIITRKKKNFTSFTDFKQKTDKNEKTTDLLIDFNSPPCSPTLTTRSESSPSSQIESGFEDDFDSLVLSNSTTPSFPDIWSDDPFSPVEQSALAVSPFELSNDDPKCKHKRSILPTQPTSTKPTIIRAKNNKPCRPPPPKLRPSSTPPSFVSMPLDPMLEDWSPPMPNCPPPPPPPEVLTILDCGPSLPPRPVSSSLGYMEKKTPYCIALYDYKAAQPDELSFKANDVIYLKDKVNDNWLLGRLMDKEGMFPGSYTQIVVPLEEPNVENLNECVIAIHTFQPETWDDLPFQEGETILVTKRINENWLFGECNGRTGQFPVTYVSDVFHNIEH